MFVTYNALVYKPYKIFRHYRYTNEYQGDYNDLIYLRARHYAPGMGRFLTRDTREGDTNQPLSFNRWGYVEGNPTNRVNAFEI
jgi:RHS repeat-associated protein